MTTLSQLENALTSHIRAFLTDHFSNDTIRKYSFIVSLVVCLFYASVVTFSMFTAQFIEKLHYSQMNINVIGGMMSVGLYLSLPFLGYLSDSHGPVLLALTGMALCPGYLLAAATFNYGLSYIYMSIAFLMIGCGTSSAYFCSLLTCAKIYPERKALSISLPVTFYGASSVLLSFLFQIPFFKDPVGEVKVYMIFMLLAVMYLFVGLLNWVASCIVTIEKEIVFNKQRDETREPDENTSLLTANFLEETSHEKKFKQFLSDPTMKFFYIAFFLLGGMLELFVTNLGSITSTVGANPSSDVGAQVSVFSLFSTLTRIVVAFLNDYLSSAKGNMSLILISVAVSTVTYVLVTINYSNLTLITAMCGVGYGSMFTLLPTLVATIWGVDILGSTWGMFLSAPAFGSLTFGLFYAFEFDSYCDVKINNADIHSFMENYCLSFTFALFSLGIATSGVILFLCWRLDWSRRLK
ncbi:hypothetical protein CANARDRAFT_9259 [[Candida] arabinofermentans NRRL YB-2248]|uniref:Probable transporter MCH1 n=1 Tax=[Candida] arabinofermentans NRRL YB-2248 TaxID=983967 RepID=A0A1E4SW18_9ASCO|nr:hypothetical protein CANARDRAFT_9259 [[Candida] arabinofermentans NRRL YB-2248]